MTTHPLFRMTVEEALSIATRGTVVTGKIEAGILNVGDEVVIQGKNGERKTVVSGLEVLRKVVSQAKAGDSVGILFKDISGQDVQSGDVIVCPNSEFA